MKITPAPCARSLRTMPEKSRISVCDSAAVGSSRITTRAFCDSARAISTRWRSARLRSLTRVLAPKRAPMSVSAAWACAFIAGQSTKLLRHALQPDAARVHRHHAGEQFDQRRLAGAVLAHQGQHLAAVQVQIDSA